MKGVKVEVTGNEGMLGSWSVDLVVGDRRFELSAPRGHREDAEAVAKEVRSKLGLPTSPATIELSDVEKKQADEFTLLHPYGCGKANDFSIRYTATGVGTKKVVTCHGCGEEKDVSDYGSW